jgi:hypothetical protein
MLNNYWLNNDIIPASQEEKREILAYEIQMFRETCKQLDLTPRPKTDLEQFYCNLLVESLAIHTRILVDFFYRDLFSKKGNKKNQNDIIAQDFMPNSINWLIMRPPITQLLYDAKEKANKQLAHLSLWRLKIERDGKKGWDYNGIRQDLEIVIEKFENVK